MSDPWPEFSPMARRLAEALQRPDWEQVDDSALEHLLDSAEPEAVSEARQEEILTQARQLIRQWETPPMAAIPHPHVPDRPPAGGRSSASSSRNRTGTGAAVVLAGIVLLAMAVLMMPSSQEERPGTSADNSQNETVTPIEYFPPKALTARPEPPAPKAARAAVGSTIETAARERRRLMLPDGSALFLNENTRVQVKSDRKLLVQTGEVFVEVVPQELTESKTPFVVETPQKSITALGTKFAVKASRDDTDVLVTQGKVKVTGIEQPISAGQILEEGKPQPAPRISEALRWTKELMAAAESPLVPKSEHAGGALVAIDPNGQEMSLTLRKQHIDVHIEDGFARTTIDQTYFNSSWGRLEGTFYFPLPADASLSRLAMYVGENLMEGGMAERDHARNVFEQIRYTRRDPALLEWVDGSTFKMRVFPLEPRQEKRIIISYTQRLDSAYGKVHYRFPAGHSLELIRDWSTHILIKNYAGYDWTSPSHKLEGQVVGEDLILEASAHRIVDDRDLVLELEDDQEPNKGDKARFSRMVHEGHQYLMLRYRPDLKGELERKPRNWVFLFETGGNRNALLARVQIEVLKTILENAEHSDTFSILTAATRTKAWKEKPSPATAENIHQAVEHLNNVHLVGALDLGKALEATQPFVEQAKDNAESYLVHLGAGVSVLGDKETDDLLRRLPAGAKYVGVGVGKRWSESFMKAAANHTGGHFTQINPDEEVRWRSFELFALLNSPRVLNVQVAAEGARFLQVSETLAQGEELCAITRLSEKQELPKVFTVTGTLAGKPFEKAISVERIAENAGYLPRTWARLEIDRLVAEGAEQHKPEIIELSKAMYVMSPFTSLLVLETEEMYQQFNVDRGRKDHWALYPCPPKIPIVYEPNGQSVVQTVTPQQRAKSVEELLQTILVRMPRRVVHPANGQMYLGLNVLQVYNGAYAAPIRDTQFLNYWSYGGIKTWEWEKLEDQNDALGMRFNLESDPKSIAGIGGGMPGNLGWARDGGDMGIMPSGSVTWNAPATLSRLANPRQSGQSFGPFSDNLGDVIIDGKFSPGTNNQFSDLWSNTRYFAFAQNSDEWRWDEWNRNQLGRISASLQEELGSAEGFGGSMGPPLPNVRLQIQNETTEMFPKLITANLEKLRARDRFVAGFSLVDLYGEDLLQPIRSRQSGHWTLGRFGDLTAFAPGLNTLSADVESLLESQGPAELAPQRGQVDPQAKALIDRARSRGWELVTLPAGKGEKAPTICCDGQGRFVYERTLSEGLKERVVSDGQSLWHIYEDIGLAAQRTVSRFHRAEVQSLVPWLVPPVEDLAVGSDVKSLNDHTIAIVPIPEKDSENQAEVYLLMVFRPDGSLQEKQLVEAGTNKPLWRVKFTGGSVEVVGADGKSLRRAEWQRQTAEAPDLQPSLEDLVVLPLPHRNPGSLLSPEEQQLVNNSQFGSLADETAQALLGSYYATGDMNRLWNLLHQRFFAKEDYRIGLYVLSASVYPNPGYGYRAPYLTQKHPNSPLAQYLERHFQWVNSGTHHEVSLDGSPFLEQLAMARNVYSRWWLGEAVANRSAAEIRTQREKDLETIAKLQSPSLHWLVLKMMQSKDTDPEGLAEYLRAAEALARKSDSSIAARYQAAFWRSELGQTAEAVEELETLTKELLKAGVLPPITEDVRTGFVNHEGIKAWEAYLERIQTKFLKEDDRMAAFAVVVRAAEVKKDLLSQRLLKNALDGLSPKKHPQASLWAAGYLQDQKRFAEAEELIAPLLKAKGWSQMPGLWRKASEIAAGLDQEALSVARLERALDLEYKSLPELVNLQTIRNDYMGILSRLEGLAQQEAEADLKERVIRLADRWRLIDPDDTSACQTAGRILMQLDEKELAWDYFTTPLAERPNESAPWLALAQEMARQNNIDRADWAYREAFAAESTNAEILWAHAHFLKQNGREEDAQELFEKLAHGDWQPRFQNLKTQAQQQLNLLLQKDK